MLTITRSVEFDAGHRVAGHEGKCRSPHGHRYKVLVTLSGEVQPDGMILDFGVLAQVLNEYVHDVFDHAMVLDQADPLALVLQKEDPSWKVVGIAGPPTAENFARLIGQVLQAVLGAVTEVVVYETPKCSARWTP